MRFLKRTKLKKKTNGKDTPNESNK